MANEHTPVPKKDEMPSQFHIVVEADRQEDDRKAILRERARCLAQAETRTAPDGTNMEVAEFMLASERYAFSTHFIREILLVKNLTPLPGIPPFVAGIMNVRGEILSVIDLKQFFNLPAKGLTDLHRVIILQNESMEVGILVDSVLGVSQVSTGDSIARLPTLGSVREEYLKWITRDRLIILSAEKLLIDPKLVVNDNYGS